MSPSVIFRLYKIFHAYMKMIDVFSEKMYKIVTNR